MQRGSVRRHTWLVKCDMHGALSSGYVRRSGRADQLSMQRKLYCRVRVCSGQRVTHGVDVPARAILAGRGGGVQCVSSRYVRCDVGADQCIVQRELHCGVRLPRGVHVSNGLHVCRWAVLPGWRCGMHGMPRRHLWSDHCLDHNSLHRAVSSRQVRVHWWTNGVQLHGVLHCGLRLPRGVHVSNGLHVCRWAVLPGWRCGMHGMPRGPLRVHNGFDHGRMYGQL